MFFFLLYLSIDFNAKIHDFIPPPFFFQKESNAIKPSQVLFTRDCYLFILAAYDDFPGFAIKGYCLLFLLSPLIYIKEFDINQTFILSSYLCFFFFFFLEK